MKSMVRCFLYVGILLLIAVSSGYAVLDDFRRDIKERLDPGQSFGLYQKALEVVAPFESVCDRIEANISQSDWNLITRWDLETPGVCESRGRVYLLRNEDHDRAVLAKGVRHLIFLPLRIGVYKEGPKVVVVFTNPELLAKVFFADLPFVDQDEMLSLAREAKKDLVTFSVKGMEGTILTEQLPPIRNNRDVRFFWSRYQEHLDLVRRVPIRDNPETVLKEVCERIEKGFQDRAPGWRVIFHSMVQDRACIIGVSNRNIEDQMLNFSGLKWPSILDRDPCSGIYHLTQFPFEILVFVEEGEVRVGILDQFWRMRFYLWDDPLRTGSIFLARDPNLSSHIYEALLKLVDYP